MYVVRCKLHKEEKKQKNINFIGASHCYQREQISVYIKFLILIYSTNIKTESLLVKKYA